MRKTIGDFLVTANIITEQQRKECQQEIETSGVRFEQCLLDKNFITPEQLAQAYATYSSVPYVEKINDQMADLTLLAKIPLKFLRENVVMPIMLDNQITILTSDPFQFQPIDELNLLLGGSTRYALATPRVIIDGINRYYPLEGTKQMIEELEEEKGAPEAVEFAEIEEKDILAMAQKRLLLNW